MKRICQRVDFVVSENHSIKEKENEKLDEYHDLARELEKLWNMKVTVVPIIDLTWEQSQKHLG